MFQVPEEAGGKAVWRTLSDEEAKTLFEKEARFISPLDPTDEVQWRTVPDTEMFAQLERGPIIATSVEPTPGSQTSYEHEAPDSITQNIDIMCKVLEKRKDTPGNFDRREMRRLRFAAYRLYKYNQMLPAEISTHLFIREFIIDKSRIQDWIGSAFKELCLANDSCVFKPYLAA